MNQKVLKLWEVDPLMEGGGVRATSRVRFEGILEPG